MINRIRNFFTSIVIYNTDNEPGLEMPEVTGRFMQQGVVSLGIAILGYIICFCAISKEHGFSMDVFMWYFGYPVLCSCTGYFLLILIFKKSIRNNRFIDENKLLKIKFIYRIVASIILCLTYSLPVFFYQAAPEICIVMILPIMIASFFEHNRLFVFNICLVIISYALLLFIFINYRFTCVFPLPGIVHTVIFVISLSSVAEATYFYNYGRRYNNRMLDEATSIEKTILNATSYKKEILIDDIEKIELSCKRIARNTSMEIVKEHVNTIVSCCEELNKYIEYLENKFKEYTDNIKKTTWNYKGVKEYTTLAYTSVRAIFVTQIIIMANSALWATLILTVFKNDFSDTMYAIKCLCTYPLFICGILSIPMIIISRIEKKMTYDEIMNSKVLYYTTIVLYILLFTMFYYFCFDFVMSEFLLIMPLLTIYLRKREKGILFTSLVTIILYCLIQMDIIHIRHVLSGYYSAANIFFDIEIYLIAISVLIIHKKINVVTSKKSEIVNSNYKMLYDYFVKLNQKIRVTVHSIIGLGELILFDEIKETVREEAVTIIGYAGNIIDSINEIINEPDESIEELKGRQEATISATRAKALIVDDVTINLKVIKSIFEKMNISVDDADSGEEALKLVAYNYYDLIFIDHIMPEMDGVETLRRIKECPGANKETPIIAITSNALKGSRDYYLSNGFDDYMSKPVLVSELEEILKKYLPNHLIENVNMVK